MEDRSRRQVTTDHEISELLALIEGEVFARQADEALPHVGSVLLELSTQHRLPGPPATEALRQQMQHAITASYRSDDAVFSDYMGFLPAENPNNKYPTLTTRRLIVPFLADLNTRNYIRDKAENLATWSPILWHLRNLPEALIRRYYVVDRNKTCLNTFRVRLTRNINSPPEQEADLYVIGLHGNADDAQGILQNTLSVVYNTLFCNARVDVNTIEVISFDFRGSIASPGKHQECLDDLVDQAIDKVCDLLGQGIPAENIVLHGHSLGGYIGVIAAYKLMELGHNVHYFGDRPPNSVTDFAAAAAGSFGSVFSGPARFFSKHFFSAYQCDGSALYLELPPTHRACLASEEDEVVLYDASLVAVLRSRHKIDEGIIVDKMHNMKHMTPMGNLGIYGDNYNLDENPFLQFLLKRVRPNKNVVTQVEIESPQGPK